MSRNWIAAEESLGGLLDDARATRAQVLERVYELSHSVVAAARDAGALLPERAAPEWLMQPIFVCGHHRTGTTLLQQLLDGHPQLVVLPGEATYFDSFAYVARADPDARALDRYAAEWVARFVDPNFAPHFRLGRATGDHMPALEFVRRLYGWCAALRGMDPVRLQALLALVAAYADMVPAASPRAWVEKTPLNEHHAGALARLPRARFIHLVRHPERALASLCEAYARGGRAAEFDAVAHSAALAGSMRAAARNTRALGCNYLIIRYEELVEDTAVQMERVRRFAAIDPSPTLLVPTADGRAVAANSSFDAPPAGVVRATRSSALAPRERLVVDAIAGRSARALGYQVEGASAAARARTRLRHLVPLTLLRLREIGRHLLHAR